MRFVHKKKVFRDEDGLQKRFAAQLSGGGDHAKDNVIFTEMKLRIEFIPIVIMITILL